MNLIHIILSKRSQMISFIWIESAKLIYGSRDQINDCFWRRSKLTEKEQEGNPKIDDSVLNLDRVVSYTIVYIQQYSQIMHSNVHFTQPKFYFNF